jgi:hypothetical protein
MKWNILPLPQTPDSICLGPNFFHTLSKLKISKKEKDFRSIKNSSKCDMGTKNTRSTSRSTEGSYFEGSKLVKKHDYSVLQGNTARRKVKRNKARQKEIKLKICPALLWSTLIYLPCYSLK